MQMIDYSKPAQVRVFRSITLGSLTANVGAIISLTLVSDRPEMLEWAIICFASSLPLLVACAVAFDRVLNKQPTEIAIDGWLRSAITTCTLASLVATNCGYMFIMWHYSSRALVAYQVATFAGAALICCVGLRIRVK